MQKWQYAILRSTDTPVGLGSGTFLYTPSGKKIKKGSTDPIEVTLILNELAEKGWEVLNMTFEQNHAGTMITNFLLKRPKPETSEEGRNRS